MNEYRMLCTEMYDLDKPSAPEDALSFYIYYAEKAKGPVLAPMCGTGRFLIPLSERGFSIDGFDNSVYMLETCKRKCETKQLNANLWNANLENFDAGRKYSLILIPSGSYGLIICNDAVAKSLKNLKDHLLPGGTLVLEIETPSIKPDNSVEWTESKRRKRKNGDIIVENVKTSYDTEKRLAIFHLRYELLTGNKIVETECMDLVTRLYYLEEFKDILKANGFKKIKSLKAYDHTTPSIEDGTVAFECKLPFLRK